MFSFGHLHPVGDLSCAGIELVWVLGVFPGREGLSCPQHRKALISWDHMQARGIMYALKRVRQNPCGTLGEVAGIKGVQCQADCLSGLKGVDQRVCPWIHQFHPIFLCSLKCKCVM